MLGKSWLEPDGEKMWLHVPETIASGSVFTVQLRRPCNTWIKVRRTAVLRATVTAGAVASIAVVDGGAGYLSTDTLTVTIAGGSGATATATRTGDAITSVAVGAGGSGYVQATVHVTILDPTGTWATSTVGPVNDLDESLPETDRVTAVAYWQLCTRMARKGPKPQQEEWEREAKMAAAVAAPFLEWQVEAPTPRRGTRVPRHPSGRSWRPTLVGSRRWP